MGVGTARHRRNLASVLAQLGGTLTSSAPSAPSNLTASQPFNQAQAALAWTAGSGATGYKLYGRVSGIGSYTLFATFGNVTSITDTSVDYSANNYDLKLTAINAGGESAASNVATTNWAGG